MFSCARPGSVLIGLDFFSELWYNAVLDNNNQKGLEDIIEGFRGYYRRVYKVLLYITQH